MNLGLKYDKVDIEVDYNVNRGGSKGNNTIQKDYFLPSLNLKYNLNDKTRFAWELVKHIRFRRQRKYLLTVMSA